MGRVWHQLVGVLMNAWLDLVVNSSGNNRVKVREGARSAPYTSTPVLLEEPSYGTYSGACLYSAHKLHFFKLQWKAEHGQHVYISHIDQSYW